MFDVITFPMILQYHLLNLQLLQYDGIITSIVPSLSLSKLCAPCLISLPSGIKEKHLLEGLLSIPTSPFVLLTGFRYLKTWIMDVFADKLQAEIMTPFPPDRYSALYNNADNLYDRFKKDSNARKENLNSWSGRAISRILNLLGWSWLSYKPCFNYYTAEDPNQAGRNRHQLHERVNNNAVAIYEQQGGSHLATLRYTNQDSRNNSATTVSFFPNVENDRISEYILDDVNQHSSATAKSYRRTTLSDTPSASLGFLLNEHLISLLLLPAKAAILKHAIQLLTNVPLNQSNSGSLLTCMRPSPPFRGACLKPFSAMHFTEIGIYMKRLALASGLKLAVDITLWICEWATVTLLGRKLFYWGRL